VNRWVRGALIGVVLLTVLISGYTWLSARHQQPVATRSVHLVAPVDLNGRLMPGFSVKEQLNGECETGSDAFSRAYRCFAGNHIYDPCWAYREATGPAVLCLEQPWATTATRLNLQAPLDLLGDAVTGSNKVPWGMQLVDGRRCLLAQGTHDVFDGRVVDYACDNTIVILRGIDTSRPSWVATTARFVSGHYEPAGNRNVRTAWFGRPDLT